MGQRRFDLVGLAAITAGFFVPYARASVAPIHDSALFFEYFHYFYSGFYSGQGIPRWLPYEAYGVQSDFAQLDYLSPANYLMAIVGRVLRIEDALVLFKLSVFVECLTLLLGTYLLSTLLYRHRATRMLVCLATVGSTVWYAQLHFNFRFYYLFPLALYFLARFFRENQVIWLTGAAVTGFAWLLGSRAYYAVVWVFAGLMVCLVLAPLWLRTVRRLSGRQLAGLAASLALISALGGGYGYLVMSGRDHVSLQTPDRDANGHVTLQTFLTYGGTVDKRGLVRRLVTGLPTHLENGAGRDESIYCGLPIALFFVLAFVTVNDVWFSAIAAAMLGLVLLSFGGGVARLVYALPGMNYYRHIAMVLGFVKMLLILAAGFGIDRFWDLPSRRRALLFWTSVILCGAVAARLLDSVMFARVVAYAAVGVVAGLAWGRPNLRVLKSGLAAALLIDLALFQANVLADVPRLTAGQRPLLESTRVRPVVWQGTRLRTPETAEASQALAWATRPDVLAVYSGIHTFARFDSCAPEMRLDIKSTGVERFTDRLRPGDLESNPIVGCGVPKLRVVREHGQLNGRTVTFPTNSQSPGVLEPASGSREEDPQVVSFASNTVTVRVDNQSPGDAWLLYADAYHPGWSAYVNERPEILYTAFDAFKAVRLVPGLNVIRLVFQRPLADLINQFFALLGAALAFGMLWWFGLTVIREAAGRGRLPSGPANVAGTM